MFVLLLLVLALLFAALATLNVPGLPRLSWLPASVFCLILAYMVASGILHS